MSARLWCLVPYARLWAVLPHARKQQAACSPGSGAIVVGGAEPDISLQVEQWPALAKDSLARRIQRQQSQEQCEINMAEGDCCAMRRTILSHFSQRYPKIPVIKSFAASTCIAFDLMVVNLQGGQSGLCFPGQQMLCMLSAHCLQWAFLEALLLLLLLADLPTLPAAVPALQLLFKEEMEEGDEAP